MTSTVSLEALRRHVVAWQGYATRFRRASDDDVAGCVSRLSCVQLDSIAVVERSHLLVLASRIGACASEAVSRLLGHGRLFEYWAHEACLLPIEDYPLLRRRMRERRIHPWWGPVIDSDPSLADQITGAIRERGPLGSRHFEGKGGGGMWRLKPAKRMLDALWTAGQLVVSGRQGFQRLYDLPERVLPPSLLAAPLPSQEQTLRALSLRAVRARGALTERGIVEHYRLHGGVAQLAPHLRALVRAGALRRLELSDGEAPVYVPGDCELEATAPTGGALLSPFENLLWDRPFARRVLGFDHLIEVYKRPHERAFGYYVLPFVLGDRIVGRVDLKSHRDEGVLRVKAFHLEPGVRRSSALEVALHAALNRLARALGLAAIDAGSCGSPVEKTGEKAVNE